MNNSFIDVLLQIPFDIKNEYKGSKLPKLVKSILIKKDIHKVYKIINRLKTEGVIIDKSILDQYLYILENAYKPNAHFGVIENIDLIDDNTHKYVVADIRLDICNAKIKSSSIDSTFEIDISYKDDKDTIRYYTFTDSKIKSRIQDYTDYIDAINKAIVNNICEYFKLYINETIMEVI